MQVLVNFKVFGPLMMYKIKNNVNGTLIDYNVNIEITHVRKFLDHCNLDIDQGEWSKGIYNQKLA